MMDINIQECCRVCISRNMEMISIFENYRYSEDNLQIFEVIAKCASVQIHKLDGLSQQICKKCMEHLCQAFSFKQLCEDSDYKFRHNLVIGHKFESQNACSNEATQILYGEINENEINKDEFQLCFGKSEIKSEINVEETKIQYGGLEFQLPDEKSSIDLIVSNEASSQKFEFSTEESLVCEFCGQGFSESIILNNHKKLHTEEHYKSDTPLIIHSAVSSEETILNNHKEIHKEGESSNNTSEKAYKCGTCGKRFKEKAKLIIHSRIHTGEKPYECEICGKNFRHRTVFLYHKKIHTGFRH